MQNLSDRFGWMNCCQDPHSAATAGALQDIHGENTAHQLRPAIVALPWAARLLLGAAPLAAEIISSR